MLHAIQYRCSESVMVPHEKVEKLRRVIAHLGISSSDLKTTGLQYFAQL
jgi:hypothetical protein